jgi:hypothetical protein
MIKQVDIAMVNIVANVVGKLARNSFSEIARNVNN